MSFWEGFAKGWMTVDDAIRRKELFETEQAGKRKETVLELLKKKGSSKDSVASTAHYSKVLTDVYGVSQDVVMKLAESAGPEGMKKSVGMLEKTKAKYAEQGLEMPQEVVTNIFEGAVMTPNKGVFDFDAIEAQYNIVLNDEERAYVESMQSPGDVYFQEPTVNAPPKFSDTKIVQDEAFRAVKSYASAEIRKINTALQRINEIESTTKDENEKSALASTKTWLLDRQSSIKTALESADGDNPNFEPIVNIYGNTYMEKVFERYPTAREGVYQPAFEKVRQPTAVPVSSLAQVKQLVQLGVLGVGSIISYPDPDTGETRTVTLGE